MNITIRSNKVYKRNQLINHNEKEETAKLILSQ